MSRTRNTELNVAAGFGTQIVQLIAGFISRTVFIYTLGENYLGISGLFSDVLSVLSIAELGIGSAITYSLYKPIADNDSRKIKALINLYKKAYRAIGIIVLSSGILLIPFLKYIVVFKKGVDINYHLIYILLLINSVISYFFFSYRSIIIEANQKSYKVMEISIYIQIITITIQIISLLTVRNYYVYLVIPIIAGIIKSSIISVKAGRMYPIINEPNNEMIDSGEKRKLIKDIYALSFSKISNIVYKSTDNILISSFLGTVLVGLYSNYLMIISIVTSFINIISNSVRAGIGNLNAGADNKQKYNVFKKIYFLNFWLYGVCSICLVELSNHFIMLWAGRKFLFQQETVYLIVFMFLISGINSTVEMFKDACGIFRETKYWTLAAAVINLVVSIILVKVLGINGIFIGTIIAYLSTIFIADPVILYTKVFNKKASGYYLNCLMSLVVIILAFIVTNYLCGFVISMGYGGFIIKTLMSFCIPNLIYIIIYFRTREFKFYYRLLRRSVKPSYRYILRYLKAKIR